MSRHDPPPEVRAALAPLVQWLVSIVLETAAAQAKGKEGPRYYDAKSAPMGPTAFLRLAAQGAFPSFKVGKKIRAKAEDVHAYMERQQGARARAPRMPVEAPPVDVNDLSVEQIVEMNIHRSVYPGRGKRL